uniref:Uncharacterized protein n=1 Tax=viral metagenome TaxID=1070528 RepID=A0A6M3L2Q1_9ZZZZ
METRSYPGGQADYQPTAHELAYSASADLANGGGQRRPWQLTRREWLAQQQAEFDAAGREVTDDDLFRLPAEHRAMVRKALKAGHPVPDRVLESLAAGDRDFCYELIRRNDASQPDRNLWNKTLAELGAELQEALVAGAEPALVVKRAYNLAGEHRFKVRQAIEAGVAVRPEVLADYPDLNPNRGV